MTTHGVWLAAVTGVTLMAWAQEPVPASWVPTQSAARSDDYAGAGSCEPCHQRECRRAGDSQMGNSIVLPTRKYVDLPALRFQRGAFTYTLHHDGEARLTVDDGKRQITEPIFAMIGAGMFFQAYLLRHEGVPYRAAVDFVRVRGGLDLDNEADPPGSLEGALGRHHSEKYVRDCFACHSPASVTPEGIDFVHRPVGNTCEVCHGPGARHVALERTGKPEQAGIFNSGHLSPAEESDFCGQCHTTAAAMRAQNAKGTRSVISEPYRLQTSRCWNPNDRRISCTACHDPHAPIERDTAAYDRKCEACHSSFAANAAASAVHGRKAIAVCPVGTHDCAGCHMPRVSAPDTPIIYADHRIRIAKADTPFPE